MVEIGKDADRGSSAEDGGQEPGGGGSLGARGLLRKAEQRHLIYHAFVKIHDGSRTVFTWRDWGLS